MKTVIMAGGKGSRIASVASDIPKPMIPILQKPILQYEIECLRDQGLTEIILVIGYLGACAIILGMVPTLVSVSLIMRKLSLWEQQGPSSISKTF